MVRASAITFSEPPTGSHRAGRNSWSRLEPVPRREIYVEVGPTAEAPSRRARYRAAAPGRTRTPRAIGRRGGPVRTSGRLFNEWMAKSRADLALLTTELPTGPYPYAGIPWFSTPFGRDAIITALQMLWLDPTLARGVLAFLARHQARRSRRFRIPPPARSCTRCGKGEMSALRETPVRAVLRRGRHDAACS